MPRTPSAFPFSGRLRRRAINPTPPKRVKAWGEGPLRPEVMYPVVEHTRPNRATLPQPVVSAPPQDTKRTLAGSVAQFGRVCSTTGYITLVVARSWRLEHSICNAWHIPLWMLVEFIVIECTVIGYRLYKNAACVAHISAYFRLPSISRVG